MRQQRDLYIRAARVLLVQLEFLEVQRFRALCHNEGRSVTKDRLSASESRTLKGQRQSIGRNSGGARCGRSDQLGGVMGLDRVTGAPALGDQIDPYPEGKINIVNGGEMSEQ